MSWNDRLTKKQQKHLKDMGLTTLERFWDTRKEQEKVRAVNEKTGMAPGIAEPCWECWEIAHVLSKK